MNHCLGTQVHELQATLQAAWRLWVSPQSLVDRTSRVCSVYGDRGTEAEGSLGSVASPCVFPCAGPTPLPCSQGAVVYPLWLLQCTRDMVLVLIVSASLLDSAFCPCFSPDTDPWSFPHSAPQVRKHSTGLMWEPTEVGPFHLG